MNGNSLGVVLSPEGSAVAEQSEGERSEPKRRGATAEAGAAAVSASRPDPEVVAKAKRRTFTAGIASLNAAKRISMSLCFR